MECDGSEPTTNIENDSQQEQQPEQAENSAFRTKKRKLTSSVWTIFKPLQPGQKSVQCGRCKERLSYKPGGSTTSLKRHAEIYCPRRRNEDTSQGVLNITPNPLVPTNVSVEKFKYDYAKVREAAAHMILVHEYSFNQMEHEMFNNFMRVNTPYWQKISRARAKEDCLTSYEIEKTKLKTQLKSVSKISITTDCWRSDHQKIEYMVVTGHFLLDWKLHKRILNFVHIPPPVNGLNVSDHLFRCFVEWGIEDKVITVTVDNASYNDLTVRFLKDSFSAMNNLFFEGKIFHMRCAAHIVNLLVQDGLTEVENVIFNLRESVKYLANSTTRLHKFSEIKNQLNLPVKKLILDCKTRWNSTYNMLENALELQKVFPRYAERDDNYVFLPSEEDWLKAKCVCDFLEVFYDVTKIISGSEYPTANLFLTEVWRVKEVLNQKLVDERSYIKAMAKKMDEKFNKYWGECHLVMSIAAVLDPRYKIALVEYCFKLIYSESEATSKVNKVREALYDLFKVYVDHSKSNLSNREVREIGTSSTIENTIARTGKSRFDDYINYVENYQPLKSDLEVYLEEGAYRTNNDDRDRFDALVWWKENELKFRTLSKMASDILAIPITTVASESAFSAGSRVIDNYRASLSTETVQALLCGGDWIRHLYGISTPSKVSIEDMQQEWELP